MLDWGSDDSYHPGRAEMLSTEDIPSWLLAVVAAVTFVLGAWTIRGRSCGGSGADAAGVPC